MNIRTQVGEFGSKKRQQYHQIGTWTLDHGVGVGDIGSELLDHGVGVGNISSESSAISLVVDAKDW